MDPQAINPPADLSDLIGSKKKRSWLGWPLWLTAAAVLAAAGYFAWTQTHEPAAPPSLYVTEPLSRGEIGYVTLTSANIARALLSNLDETSRSRIRDGTVKLVSISPVTSEAIRELGFEPAAEAIVYTTEGLVEALIRIQVGK